MSPIHRSTLSMSCLLCAVVFTTACATNPSITAELADVPLICRHPMFEQESLGELIDKYAPSAIEWSLLPKLADRSSPSQPRGKISAETERPRPQTGACQPCDTDTIVQWIPALI